MCMLIITQAQQNDIICTLKEAQTLDNPVWLFVFTCKQNGLVSACIATDISIYPERYNKFIIEEKTAPNNLIGEIQLKDTGEYYYAIYEQHSSTNLYPDNAANCCEVGQMRVMYSAAATPQFDTPINNPIIFQQ